MNNIYNQRILILGDSITHTNKYVGFIEILLAEKLKVYKPDLISIGLSSETASGLSENEHPFMRPNIHERLNKTLDVISPDMVIASYGVNDAIYHPLSEEIFTAYKTGILKLVSECNQRKIKVVLLTPPYFDSKTIGDACRPIGALDYSYMNPYIDYADVLEEFSKWIITLEKDIYKVIDIFNPLKDFVKSQREKNNEYKYGDGIHPCLKGHFILAKTILENLFDYSVNEIPKYVENPQSKPIFDLIEKRCNLNSGFWRKYIGHTNPYVDDVVLSFDEHIIMTNKLNNEIIKLVEVDKLGVTLLKGAFDWQIIQRDKFGYATMTLEGIFNAIGTDISVQVRIVDENNGAPVTRLLDWMDTKINLNKNTFKIKIEKIPEGGLYRVETRIRRTHSDCRPMRGDYIHHIGVGDIYVVAGQSNASGTGKGEALDPPTLGVHLFGNDEKWKLASHPLEDATGTLHPITITGIFHGTCPWLSFGRKIFSKTNIPVGIIPTALGGSPMSMWINELGEPSVLFTNMQDMIIKSGGNIAGVLWYQGESDCPITKTESRENYAKSFTRFVENVRNLVNNENLPIYTGQLNRFVNLNWSWDFSEMRELQRQIAKSLKNVHMIVTIDLPMSDEVHINSVGNIILGERFADAALAENYEFPILWRFPEVKTASFIDDEHTEILVGFINIQGDLTTGMYVNDFSVTSNGDCIEIETAKSLRDNKMLIKLKSSAKEGCVLHCLQGINPVADMHDDGGRCLTPCSVEIV